MELILPSVYALLFFWMIFRFRIFRIEGISGFVMAGLFLLKIIGAIAVWWVFSRHYNSSDLQAYFDDGKKLFYNLFHPSHPEKLAIWNASFEGSLFNGSRIMILLNALLIPFSFGNIFVHFVFFSFFSFLGLSSLYKSLLRHFPEKQNLLLLLIFFVPDIFFFSSGIFKESLAICLLGWIIGKTDFGLRKKYSSADLLLVLILMGLLFLLKIYIAFAIVPVLFANFLFTLFGNRLLLVAYLLAGGLFITALVGLAKWSDDGNVLKLISDRQAKAISEAKGGVFLMNDRNFIWVNYHKQNEVLELASGGYYTIRPGSAYISWKLDNMQDTTFVLASRDTARYRILYSQVPAKSVIPVKRLRPELFNFIAASPLALFNCLLRPMIHEMRTWLLFAAGMENWFILLCIALPFYRFNRNAFRKKEILLFLFFSSMIILLITGMSTPVIGAMIRYRTVGLLLLLPMLGILTDFKRIRIPFLRTNLSVEPAGTIPAPPVPSPDF